MTTIYDRFQRRLVVSRSPSIHSKKLKWLMILPGATVVVDRLGNCECRRRLFHMSPSLLPFGLLLVPRDHERGQLVVSITVLLAIAALSLAIAFCPKLKRPGEKHWMHAVLGYMVPVVVPMLFWSQHYEFGLMTLQILAVGDGSATFGGVMFGGRTLPWNRHKTLTGLACFTICGSLAATCSYWLEASTRPTFADSFLICGIASLCAAIVESLPIQSNDNLRVGITALLAGITMSAFFAP